MTLPTSIYNIFFEQIQRKVFREKLKETDVPLETPSDWKRIDINHLHDVFGRGITDPQYFYRIYNAARNALPEGECQVRDDVICKSLEYLGYNLSSNQDALGVAEKAKKLYQLFYSDIKSTFLDRSLVPDKYRAVVDNLINNTWLYCFRGHLNQIQRMQGYSWMVWNEMTFEMESPDKVRVSKIMSRAANASNYSDVIGYIDFEGSHESVLNINLRNTTEHCHIKLAIRGVADRDLYLSQFLQSGSDGHLGAGSAILFKTTDVNVKVKTSGECRFDLEVVRKYKEENIVDHPKDLPKQFDDIFFYFIDVGLNTLRATNDPITNIDVLQEWKTQWDAERKRSPHSELPH